MAKVDGKAVRAAVVRWQRWLGLEHWQITVRLGRIAGGHRATCEADYEYREAIIRFDPQQMLKHGDELEEIVGHELLHAVIVRSHTEIQRLQTTKGLEDKWCAVEEGECTHLSRAFLRLAKEGRLV